ncbi:MAG TPA: CotH kinase family protein, partial [Bacteroidales bacterium]|nr:CotH kinase family protein [Bacteroidales bacterium]
RFFAVLLVITKLSQTISAQSGIDHWESVVYSGDTWHYYVNSSSYPTIGWHTKNFDDSSWMTGNGGFGYADNDDQTIIPNPPYPTSVHARIEFNIIDTSQIAMALLNMDFDDGFIAWINGKEIARSNMGIPLEDPQISYASADHEAAGYQGLDRPSFLILNGILKQCLVNGTNVLAVQVNNFGTTSSDLSCIPFLSVALKSPGSFYRAVPSWFIEPFTEFGASDIPLAMVETNGNTIVSEQKVIVDFGIIDNGPGSANHLYDEWNGYHGKAGIEYRGSSSMMFPKKNYALETRTDQGLDTAVSLLGLPAEADWVLHGPYSDKSLVRNRLAYDLAREMGHYAPRARFCELFVDYQYQGLYVLIEKIKRDSNRVAIAKLDTSDTEGHALTGGYIIKIDRSADGSYTDGWFSNYPGSGASGQGPFFAWHYPKWEDILPVQMNYIRNRINRFEDALFSYDFRNPYTGYRSHVDVNSFIDYFILVELSKNVDGYRLSTFLYKDRDDRDPLIHMGPVWDYDLAFGNADYYNASVISGWNYPVQADGWGTPYWWSRLISDSYFSDNLDCRWRQLRQNVLSDESLLAMIDAYVDTMDEAVDRNFGQWPIHSQYIWPNAYVGNTFAQDINYMKNWIIQRAAWMDTHMPGDCTTSSEEYPATSFILSARPNPAREVVNLEIQNPLQLPLNLDIINTAGVIVYSELTGIESIINRRIALNPGIYIIKARNANEHQTLKVVVQ